MATRLSQAEPTVNTQMNPLLRLVMTGVLMALACVATMVIQIPSPTHGYMNLGDCVVLLSGCLLGPVYGAVAGGVGSALADLLSGYAVYVPGTLVIKAVMAYLGIAFIGCRQARLILWFIRKFHEKYGSQ